MTTPTIRKSGRIKSRKKSSYSSDCYDDNLDIDISEDISNLLSSHSKERKGVNKSFPNVAQKLHGNRKSTERCNNIEETSLDAGQHFDDINLKSIDQSTPKSHSRQRRKTKHEKDFVCSQCDKVITDLASFKRHLKSHNGEKPFSCGECEKSFSESCSLKRHMKTHEDERPYTCDVCFKSFRDSAGFNRHLLTHTERTRSFQCSICDKNFTDKSGLKRHQRTHSGLRPFECVICYKTFSESGSFRRHQKIHLGVREHQCPRCQRSFMEKQSLVRHQKTVCGFWEAHEEDITSDKDISNDRSSVSSLDLNVSACTDTLSSKNGLSLPLSFPAHSQQTPSPASASSNKKRDHPSLVSLIQRDPNLYDSISELVDSIDSYEKMLDLCGDGGQKEIEAALTREPATMPENLMCFECGELLVDGENFHSEGKSFNSSNSFRCLNCEEDEDRYGEPPVLTAEDDQVEEMPPFKEEEISMSKANNDNVYSGYQETLVKLETRDSDEDSQQHAELVNVFDSQIKAENNPSTSSSKDGNQFDLTSNSKLILNKAIPHLISVDSVQTNQSFQGSWDNASSIEYEAADPNIPSVFPCHLCTKVFATSSFLQQHLVLHKKSPFKCMVCGKNFGGGPALKRHMRIHTGEKPYVCPSCNKKFRDPSNFGKHKRFCLSNVSVPSPIDSTSSSNSVMSTPSIEEGEDICMKNIEDNHLPSQLERTSLSSLPNHISGSNEEIPQEEAWKETAVPFMTVTPSIDDYDEFSENETNLKEKNQQSAYIPCEICQKLCESKQHLDMHMNFHNGDPDVTCIECGKSFADCHGLKRHMRIHAEYRPFVCDYCNRGYCDNWSLKKHKNRGCLGAEVKVPIDFLYPCRRCSRVFADNELLEEHMKSHKGKLKFECDICLKKFSEAFNLKRHRRLHMTICSSCGQEFKSINEMTEHQKECHASASVKSQDDSTSQSFPCPDCGRTYSTKAYLDRHRKFHLNSKVYVCEICNKKFAEAFKLSRHKQIHTRKKPFVCKDCGKGFADEAYLKRHILNSSCTICKTMKGAETFPCQYCDKVFTKNYMLVRHMNVHSQERPFSCNVCSRSYKDTSSLKRHQLIHQGTREFICSVCGKDFYYSDSLKRHMSGRCGKGLKSQKYRQVKRRNGIKVSMQDTINNNGTKKEEGLLYTSLDHDVDLKSRRLLKRENASKSKVMHTLPYKPRSLQYCPLSASMYNKPARDVKIGPWSCRRKKHCWQCDTKMSSMDVLKSHIRIHQHKKKFLCLHCFARFSRKVYWKAHLLSCLSTPKLSRSEKLLTSIASSESLGATNETLVKRPRRSIPRARWSWLSQI